MKRLVELLRLYVLKQKLRNKNIELQDHVIERAIAAACTFWSVPRSEVNFCRDRRDPYKVKFSIGKGVFIHPHLDIIEYIEKTSISKYTVVEMLCHDMYGLFFNALMNGSVEEAFTDSEEDK